VAGRYRLSTTNKKGTGVFLADEMANLGGEGSITDQHLLRSRVAAASAPSQDAEVNRMKSVAAITP
jgi:hypothetical protein